MAALRVHPGPGQTGEAARAYTAVGQLRRRGPLVVLATRGRQERRPRRRSKALRGPRDAGSVATGASALHAFSQTQWSLRDRAVAAAGLPCATDAGPRCWRSWDRSIRRRHSALERAGRPLQGRLGRRLRPLSRPAVRRPHRVKRDARKSRPRRRTGVGEFRQRTAALSLMAQELAPRLDALPAGDCR